MMELALKAAAVLVSTALRSKSACARLDVREILIFHAFDGGVDSRGSGEFGCRHAVHLGPVDLRESGLGIFARGGRVGFDLRELSDDAFLFFPCGGFENVGVDGLGHGVAPKKCCHDISANPSSDLSAIA